MQEFSRAMDEKRPPSLEVIFLIAVLLYCSAAFYLHAHRRGSPAFTLLALLQCNRSENMQPDPDQCMQDASDLYTAGEGQWGTDEDVFKKLFALRSPAELALIEAEYRKITGGHELANAIKSEFSSDINIK